MISVSRFEAIGARRDIFRPVIVSVRRASGENRQGQARRVADVARLHASAKSAPLTILHALKFRMSNLDKPVAIHILETTFAKSIRKKFIR